MQDLFPGFFRKSPSQIQEIWINCTFAFDANVLLNLYRYSPSTADSLLGVLKKLKDRLWLPWQAASEFHENRLGVIDKQSRSYEATSEHAKKLMKSLDNPREHPFIDQDLLVKTEKLILELTTKLDKSREDRRKLLHEDPMLMLIADLFSKRVGKNPDTKVTEKWIEEAKNRCEKKIPPGFRDVSKDGNRSYGDVLIWFELIEQARNSKSNIVFVTDDTKNDWWLEMSGQTIGPLPALVQEFANKSGQQILLYRPDRFAEFASQYLNSTLAPGVVDELRNQTEFSKRKKKRKIRKFESDTAQELANLCDHLWMHKEHASEFVASTNKLSPTDLHKARENRLSPEAVQINSTLSACKCLRNLLLSIHDISAPGYYEALAAIESEMTPDKLSLLVSFRQLPDNTVEFVRGHASYSLEDTADTL